MVMDSAFKMNTYVSPQARRLVIFKRRTEVAFFNWEISNEHEHLPRLQKYCTLKGFHLKFLTHQIYFITLE